MTTFPSLVRTESPTVRTGISSAIRSLIAIWSSWPGGCGRNTLRAVAFDLKTFFTVVDKNPVDVVAADVFDFLAHQRGDRRVVRLIDGESGLSARTIARRLSSVSGFYSYVIARDDTSLRANPVPRGLSTRRRGGRVTLGAAGPGAPHIAQDPLARRGRCPRRCTTHASGPGHGLRHGAWAGSGAARCSVCGSLTSRWPSAPCSSPKARAATNGSSRSQTPSSLRAG